MKVGAKGLLWTVTVLFMGSVPNGMVDQKVEHSGGEMPVEVFVETAWAREDGRICAQSRTLLKLDRGVGPMRVELVFDPWVLTEGTWDLSLAVAAGPGRYLCRCLHAGAARVATPNPCDLPALVDLDADWQV